MTLIEIPDIGNLHRKVVNFAAHLGNRPTHCLNSNIELGNKTTIQSMIILDPLNYVFRVRVFSFSPELITYKRRLNKAIRDEELGWIVEKRLRNDVYIKEKAESPYYTFRVTPFRHQEDPYCIQIITGDLGTATRSHAKQEEFEECARGMEKLVNIIAYPVLTDQNMTYPISFME